MGFRPFVYRLAHDLGLSGWVLNDSRGVFCEVDGPRPALEDFLERLRRDRPARAVVHALEAEWLEPAGFTAFTIRHSQAGGEKTAVVLPDVATCPACLREVREPGDRRHRYPFTNCTDCGPRFTIVEALPYDRPHTTMAGFTMCPRCQGEYEDPGDRRFHAQPNACPACGPRLSLWDPHGEVLARDDGALVAAAAALAQGEIVAAKGLGGFHLLVDARDGAAVDRLRRRKLRQEKPFALMVRDLAMARGLVEVPPEAEALLTSPECPIVLLRRRTGGRPEAVADAVAPGSPDLGVMLPAMPLQHLLMAEVGFPLVATSGNLTDEPIATDEREARERLGGVADLFLVHDRPIARHADDSVARVFAGEARLLRRARGYAPLPVRLPRRGPALLAVGGHLKNTVTLSVGDNAFVSQHLGDMETPTALDAFERVIADFLALYEAVPSALVHDLHPDYATTRWAEEAVAGDRWPALAGLPLVAVQHHHAHLASCLAENRADGPALGITWDGTGYGTDGTVWGGEVLLGDAAGYSRVARLRPFRLPGGDAAVREPRRAALALLWQVRGEAALAGWGFSADEARLLARMLEGGLRSPWSSSAGRLFDAVAAIAGLHPRVSYEGQAAMALEALADPSERSCYPLEVEEVAAPPPGPLAARVGESAPPGGRLLEVDWRPLVAAADDDAAAGVAASVIAARFHNALAAAGAELVRRLAAATGVTRIALSGGCFQNRRLTEDLVGRLAAVGCEVLLHREVPPNDGGISLGQVAAAAARRAEA